MQQNYYFNNNHPQKPFTSVGYSNPGSLPPNNAIRVPPLGSKDDWEATGQWPILNDAGDGWVLVENHRGEKGYLDGQAHEITDLGPYPEGWSSTPPPPSAEELRLNRIAQIEAEINMYDLKSVRSLKAIVDGTATQDDLDKYAEYKGLISVLREELAALREGQVN